MKRIHWLLTHTLEETDWLNLAEQIKMHREVLTKQPEATITMLKNMFPEVKFSITG